MTDSPLSDSIVYGITKTDVLRKIKRDSECRYRGFINKHSVENPPDKNGNNWKYSLKA